MAPVCGLRIEAEATERMRQATAPTRAAADGPSVRTLPGGHVVGERHVEQHDLALGLRRAPLEVLERGDHQHLRGDPVLGRADAAAQAQHRELGRARLHQLRRLGAPHPVRHHHRLAAHVLEAVGLHEVEDPVDGGLEAGRAAEPVAEGVHQPAEPAIGRAVGGGAADEAVGRDAVGGRDVGLLRLHGAGRGEEQGERERDGQTRRLMVFVGER